MLPVFENRILLKNSESDEICAAGKDEWKKTQLKVLFCQSA